MTVDLRVLKSAEIMRAIVERIGCKLNPVNEDDINGRHRSYIGQCALRGRMWSYLVSFVSQDRSILRLRETNSASAEPARGSAGPTSVG